MTTRTFAEIVCIGALCALSAPVGAQAPALDVRARLDVARWPAARASYAGVAWQGAMQAVGLELLSVDARPVAEGGALLRFAANGRLQWLVRLAVAPDAGAARTALLRWAQPVQGALVRDDASIAIADVVLTDDRGGRGRAGLVAGNVAVWVAAAEPGSDGALAVLRALADHIALRGPRAVAPRLTERAQRGTDADVRVVTVVAAPAAIVETTVEGGHVGRVDGTARVIAIADRRVGARVRATALDPLGRVSEAEIALR
ncbi:MAG: hypothetical protein IT379_35210 [Deltaproteobacteria bacterium]|nr:hypothetical protein [Deltaproteobacteria bacterium]